MLTGSFPFDTSHSSNQPAGGEDMSAMPIYDIWKEQVCRADGDVECLETCRMVGVVGEVD